MWRQITCPLFRVLFSSDARMLSCCCGVNGCGCVGDFPLMVAVVVGSLCVACVCLCFSQCVCVFFYFLCIILKAEFSRCNAYESE